MDRGSPDWTEPDERRAVVTEVLRPIVAAGVEESDYWRALRIDAGEIGSFVLIASPAAQRQIRQFGFSVVLPRDDVVEDVREARCVLWYATVLTSILSEPSNRLLQRFGHTGSAV